MAMSKGKMLTSIGGGVFVVAAGLLGWFLYDAYSTRSETEETLQEEMDTYSRYNNAAVFPSKDAICTVNTNTAAYACWRTSASAFAAQGDKTFPMDEAPSAFKQRLTEEVRRIGKLPGGAEGHLAAEGFLFGFDKYLGESAVLPETADLPRLTIQLDAITHIAEMFAKAGVLEVKDVKRLEPPKDEQTEDNGANRSKPRGRKAASADEDDAAKMTSLDYSFSILVRPSAFVDVLNVLVADARFTVVKAFAFRSSADAIVEKLNADEAEQAKKNQPESTRSRRRRRVAEEVAAVEAKPKSDNRLVVDPELDAPVQVDMTLTIYDFGRAAAAAAVPAESEGAVAEKKEAK